jgi:signal transduction histidine kinase
MKTILLADDEANLRTLVRTTLEDPGFRILEASNGRAALEFARQHRPDLILLDWMMPEMSGPEVVEALLRDDATRDIPVIMLTARGRQKDRLKMEALGVAAFLVKPFSPLQLLETVREILDRSASRLERPAPALPAPSADVEHQMNAGESQLALYARDLRRVVASERQKSEALARANVRLKNLDLLKTSFLSFISHELRTPLNAMSAVDLFDAHGGADEQAEIVDLMRMGYARFHTLISRGLEYFRWLAIERIDAKGTTDLAVLVRDTAAAAQRSAKSGASVRVACPHGACSVRGHAESLSQVLSVLLDNALKFSRESHPITVELTDLGDKLRLSVTDRGIGFPPEIAPELFQPFTIADVRHHGAGTGLSLALADAIVRAHGGTIRAESPGPGQGSTFVVELPGVGRGGVGKDVGTGVRSADALAE